MILGDFNISLSISSLNNKNEKEKYFILKEFLKKYYLHYNVPYNPKNIINK